MPSPDFLAAGRSGKHDFPRYLVTIALVITAFILGQLPLMGYLRAHGDRLDPDALAQFDFAAMGFDPNIILLFMLLPFAVGMAALLAGVRYFHMRPLRTVLTGRPRLDRSRIAFAAGLWLAITAALELVAIAWDPGNYTVTFAPLPFVLLLAVGLLFLPIQTTFEEVMMRGYLFQGIARLAPWRWIPVVITSLLFGLLHGLNPEIGEFGAALMMPYYIGVGVVLAVTVLMDEGLELAIGYHAANNLYGAILVNYEGSPLNTPSLLTIADVDAAAMLVSWLVSAVIFLYFCARRYGWRNWTARLAGPVDRGDSPSDTQQPGGSHD